MGSELRDTDIVIIGGGLVGLAASYYLAKAGKDVTVLDGSEIGRGASGSNAGSLHLQVYVHAGMPEGWMDNVRPSVDFCREAAKHWSYMEEEVDANCGVRLGGGLWVAESEEEMALVEAKVKIERELGVDSIICSRSEILERSPYLGPSVVGGSFFGGEGFANPLLVTKAFYRCAQRAGSKVQSKAEVLSIDRQNKGFKIETSRGSMKAQQVIIAAGGWTAKIARMLGLEIPVQGLPLQVSVTEGRPNIMRNQLVQHVGKGLSLKQSPQGTFIIGGGWPSTYDLQQNRYVPREDAIIGNCDVAANIVPDVRSAGLVRSWSGLGTHLEDGLPILGESSEQQGVHVLFSSLGFTMGPTLARLFADQFLGVETPIPLHPFSPDRFSRKQ